MERLPNHENVEWKRLGYVAEYSTTRVNAADLDATSFVGVDNLIANKGGRIDASYLPNTERITAYESGDILLGNIRPYLKKVWHATNAGGCSGDVLAIRIKKQFRPNLNSAFLYYLLSTDAFSICSTPKEPKCPEATKRDSELRHPHPLSIKPEAIAGDPGRDRAHSGHLYRADRRADRPQKAIQLLSRSVAPLR
jgi:type I restriction enzyme S subunit